MFEGSPLERVKGGSPYREANWRPTPFRIAQTPPLLETQVLATNSQMASGVLRLSMMSVACCMAAVTTVQAGPCAKADFEQVVDEAAGALRDLNATNKPKFQEKLRKLKDKRGWAHEQFLKEAAPFVADEKINTYDQQSNTLLEKIAMGGEAGAAAATPDCTMLDALRASMKTLVDTQTTKWTYMNSKLDTELGK